MTTILGPTASGKTSLAVALAARTGGEIISADSRQVYRSMDIGTGKDLGEYEVGGRTVPHHLIDIAEPGTRYNLFEYQRDFRAAYRDVVSRGAMPILCGGTGLYIEAVLRGYPLLPVPENPALRSSLRGRPLGELARILARLKAENSSTMHNVTDVDTPMRAIRAIEIEAYLRDHPELEAMSPGGVPSLVVGVSVDREERRRRISQRLRERLEHGLVEEVRGLLDRGIASRDLIYYGLEYRYVTMYAIGELSYGEMEMSLETAIHQFAKRQMTWFRGMERRGVRIDWISASLPMGERLAAIEALMEGWRG